MFHLKVLDYLNHNEYRLAEMYLNLIVFSLNRANCKCLYIILFISLDT